MVQKIHHTQPLAAQKKTGIEEGEENETPRVCPAPNARWTVLYSSEMTNNNKMRVPILRSTMKCASCIVQYCAYSNAIDSESSAQVQQWQGDSQTEWPPAIGWCKPTYTTLGKLGVVHDIIQKNGSRAVGS